MRYSLPSPYDDLSHTADAGIRACGATVEEALARSALALSQLQAGGGAVEEAETHALDLIAPSEDELPVELARAVLDRWYADALLLAAIEIVSVDVNDAGAALRARGWFGPFDPDRHGEGLDVKAVTYARAGFQRVSDGSVCATLIFDI